MDDTISEVLKFTSKPSFKPDNFKYAPRFTLILFCVYLRVFNQRIICGNICGKNYSSSPLTFLNMDDTISEVLKFTSKPSFKPDSFKYVISCL